MGQEHEKQPGAPADSGIRLAPNVVLSNDSVFFTFVRSSGPGGQNVNKRATKARLRVKLGDLPIDAPARRRLAHFAGGSLTDDGELVIESDEHRSQRRNRETCLDRLGELVRRALVKPKVRRKTKPSRGAIERRLKEKKERGEAKKRRRSPEP